MKFFILFCVALFAVLGTAPAHAEKMTMDEYLYGGPVMVNPGNPNYAERGYSSLKFTKTVKIFMQPEKLCIVKQAAKLYDVDPIAIAGSIIGEHTYNVDIWDIAQNGVIGMSSRWIRRFEREGLGIVNLLEEQPYNSCASETSNNFDLWNCYDSHWKTDRRNGRRHRKNWELKWTFFNPVGSGFTYGYGQLGPVRALMVTDLVSEFSGYPLLSEKDPKTLYESLLNPKVSIHYVAASNRMAIDLYRNQANFDISKNPGIIATLYNLGREQQKVLSLRDRTIEAISQGKHIPFPKVNYYGWFVNSKEKTLRKIYKKKAGRLSDKQCAQYLL